MERNYYHIYRAFTRLVQSRCIRKTPEQARITNFPGDMYSYLKFVDIGYFSKAGLPVRETTDAKKHLVTSTCATEKKVENQFS